MAQQRETCAVCQRDPQQVNNCVGECSVLDCPHRRRCWSESAGQVQHNHERAGAMSRRQLDQLFDRGGH